VRVVEPGVRHRDRDVVVTGIGVHACGALIRSMLHIGSFGAPPPRPKAGSAVIPARMSNGCAVGVENGFGVWPVAASLLAMACRSTWDGGIMPASPYIPGRIRCSMWSRTTLTLWFLASA
jgi:hypothetical protein